VFSRKNKPHTLAQLDFMYNKFESVIDMFDEKSLNEIGGGYSGDVDKLMGVIEEETIKIFDSVPEPISSDRFYNLENVSESIHESLKILNYNYFKVTMLPEFYIGQHSIEWGNIIQIYDRTCILASRGLGKSFEFSLALPIWKMYGYRKPTDLNPINLDIARRKEGLLITNEYKLGRKLLGKIAAEIKENNALWERLKPTHKDEGVLGRERIETRNGCEINLRSLESSSRGLHPDWIVVDDYGSNEWIYSQAQREKGIENFYGDTMKTLERGGTINVVGCISPNSTIITDKGLRKIGDLCPVESYKEKGLHEFELNILGQKGFNKTSHYWCNGLTKTKKIILKGGYELECSFIHPLWKMNENGLPNWCQSQDLRAGDYVALKLNQEFEGNAIDLTEFNSSYSFTYKNKNNKIHNFVDKDLAYLIGIYTADGSTEKKGRITIIKGNKGIRDFVLDYGFKASQDIKMRYQSKYLYDILKYLGCSMSTAIDKNFPKQIFEANKETIKWFLQGLFDGDGSCSIYKDGSVQISYSSISRELIYDIQNVLKVFGVFSSVTNRGIMSSELVTGKHNLYFLGITGYDCKVFLENIGFRFSGKGDKVNISSLRKLKKVNSTYRRIPYQSELIKRARKEKHRRKRGKVSTLPPFRSQEVLNKVINKDRLKIVVDWFIGNEAKGEAIDQLVKNVSEDLTYLPIISIEDSENYTVDFHIPEGNNFVTNCISSHNTPFHEKDLYAHIRENDKTFKYFEYPAIFPDGSIIASHRWNYKELQEEYEISGSLIFSREILVVPISDSSTIFPWSILENAFVGMQDYRLVQNRASFPKKFKYVSVGCDFALSANVGADSTVFSVWGIDELENYWLLYIWRKQGASHSEQIAQLKQIERDFQPSEIVAENNGFQKIMLDLAKEHNIKNITSFTTTSWNKKDLMNGLPGLAILFENGRIRFPRGDAYSKEMTDWLCSEFNSITIKPDSGRLESMSSHDDGPMAMFFAIKGVSINKKLNFVMV